MTRQQALDQLKVLNRFIPTATAQAICSALLLDPDDYVDPDASSVSVDQLRTDIMIDKLALALVI